MKSHDIHLTTARKYRNKAEYRSIRVATCGDLVVSGRDDNITPLLKLMVACGKAQISDHVGVFRGGSPIFINKATESPYMELAHYLDGRAYGVRPREEEE